MANTQAIKNEFIVLESGNQVRLRLLAGTIKDLFHQSLEGMASVLYAPYGAANPQITVPVRVSSIDVNSLVVDFLSEVLWQTEMHKAVFSEMRIKRFTNSEIEADIMGVPVGKLDRKVRAVTYQNVRVVRGEEGLWRTEVLLEV